MSNIPSFHAPDDEGDYDPGWIDRQRKSIRAEAFAEAAERVLRMRMPVPGDGPVLLLDVLVAAARAIRGMR